MMTRKNFKAIAELIRQEKLNLGECQRGVTLYDLANNLAQHFKQDNPTFDRSKFMRICGFYQE